MHINWKCLTLSHWKTITQRQTNNVIVCDGMMLSAQANLRSIDRINVTKYMHINWQCLMLSHWRTITQRQTGNVTVCDGLMLSAQANPRSRIIMCVTLTSYLLSVIKSDPAHGLACRWCLNLYLYSRIHLSRSQWIAVCRYCLWWLTSFFERLISGAFSDILIRSSYKTGVSLDLIQTLYMHW
jgi:hypothetical protein